MTIPKPTNHPKLAWSIHERNTCRTQNNCLSAQVRAVFGGIDRGHAVPREAEGVQSERLRPLEGIHHRCKCLLYVGRYKVMIGAGQTLEDITVTSPGPPTSFCLFRRQRSEKKTADERVARCL